jgi:hypothetical protein
MRKEDAIITGNRPVSSVNAAIAKPYISQRRTASTLPVLQQRWYQNLQEGVEPGKIIGGSFIEEEKEKLGQADQNKTAQVTDLFDKFESLRDKTLLLFPLDAGECLPCFNNRRWEVCQMYSYIRLVVSSDSFNVNMRVYIELPDSIQSGHLNSKEGSKNPFQNLLALWTHTTYNRFDTPESIIIVRRCMIVPILLN